MQYMEYLPYPALVELIGWCDQRSKGRIGRTCRYLRAASHDLVLWSDIVVQERESCLSSLMMHPALMAAENMHFEVRDDNEGEDRCIDLSDEMIESFSVRATSLKTFSGDVSDRMVLNIMKHHRSLVGVDVAMNGPITWNWDPLLKHWGTSMLVTMSLSTVNIKYQSQCKLLREIGTTEFPRLKFMRLHLSSKDPHSYSKFFRVIDEITGIGVTKFGRMPSLEAIEIEMDNPYWDDDSGADETRLMKAIQTAMPNLRSFVTNVDLGAFSYVKFVTIVHTLEKLVPGNRYEYFRPSYYPINLDTMFCIESLRLRVVSGECNCITALLSRCIRLRHLYLYMQCGELDLKGIKFYDLETASIRFSPVMQAEREEEEKDGYEGLFVKLIEPIVSGSPRLTEFSMLGTPCCSECDADQEERLRRIAPAHVKIAWHKD